MSLSPSNTIGTIHVLLPTVPNLILFDLGLLFLWRCQVCILCSDETTRRLGRGNKGVDGLADGGVGAPSIVARVKLSAFRFDG